MIISGGIIVNAKNRPLKEVIDRIATLGNLRYSYKNGVLYFESDTAYTKNYFVDYLFDGKLWSDVETNITSILKSNTIVRASNSLLRRFLLVSTRSPLILGYLMVMLR